MNDLWFFESLTLPDTKWNNQREKEIQRIHIYEFFLLNALGIIAYGVFNFKVKVVLLTSLIAFTAILTCLYRYFNLFLKILWPWVRSWPFTCIISLGNIQSHNSLTNNFDTINRLFNHKFISTVTTLVSWSKYKSSW